MRLRYRRQAAKAGLSFSRQLPVHETLNASESTLCFLYSVSVRYYFTTMRRQNQVPIRTKLYAVLHISSDNMVKNDIYPARKSILKNFYRNFSTFFEKPLDKHRLLCYNI